MFSNLASYIKLLELLACISAWVAWPQLKKSICLKYFPYLLTFIALYDWAGYFIKQVPLSTEYLKSIAIPVTKNGATKYILPNAWWYNLCMPIVFIFYALILHKSLEGTLKKRILKFTAYAYVVFFLISSVVLYSVISKETLGYFNTPVHAAGISILSIAIVFKLHEMITAKDESDIFRQPLFYILSALLFYYLISLPYFDLLNWFGKNESNTLKTIISNAKAIVTYILYTTYTIAFLWMKKKGIYS